MGTKSGKRYRGWLTGFSIFAGIFLGGVMFLTWYVDPFFHYHAPRPSLYYELNNERYDNDGIMRHFNYNAVVTGSSMCENFHTSIVDQMYGVQSVKVPFYGGTFYEISRNLRRGYENHNIALVIWGLDQNKILADPEWTREDLGDYPGYLYDDNPLNDIQYLMNRDVLFNNVVPVLERKSNGEPGGHTDFDKYGNWMSDVSFGREYALEGMKSFTAPDKKAVLSEEQRQQIRENVRQNIVSLAEEHPETLFELFLTPYSIAWWGQCNYYGVVDQQLETEKIALQELLTCPNVIVLSYNTNPSVIENLDNYRDTMHYGDWINMQILADLAKGTDFIITRDNLEQYLQEERDYLTQFDYESLLEEQG